ncbi:sigma-70 family RNA polymerase sigma factor [Spirosoma sp. BT702]|uniref:Sigma-70 family RNA polymerase sigma factor n=1 Tax=Spirosoma profusum TaxID=2771354 RepID=A0A927AN12_9BACT|nr:sigma-70 family RNA polymerase sigma factor [Spirosoma profusum]MBD2700904.1 sigma-70 family RNA polymerase sigma factor [Spirosoma profusum]
MFLKLFRKSRTERSPRDAADYVARYRATGDLAILGELYEQHMDMIYAVCYNYLRDEDEAKDAVMNLFEQLVNDLRRHEVHQFGPWLHSVARNYCLMHLRKHQAHPNIALVSDSPTDSDEPLLNLTDDDDTLAEHEEDLTRMEACLQTLAVEQQSCLRLFYLERKTYTEVAELTGYDLKQVKSYLQNGRRNLKICMSK